MKLKLLSLFLLPTLCFAQGAHRISQVLVKGNGISANVAPYANVSVCVANTACKTIANIYADPALTTRMENPLTADASGNYNYYLPASCVDENITSVGQGTIKLNNVCVYAGSTGTGSVTAVSVVPANGFQGMVANPNTTPAITLNVDASHYLPTTSDRSNWVLLHPTASQTITQPGGTTFNVNELLVTNGMFGTLSATSLAASTLTAGTFGYAPLTTVHLTTDGDSTTAGALLPDPTTQSWPVQLSQLPFFKNRATLTNAAVSGQRCADMTARYPSAVAPFKPNGTTITKSYLTVMIGRNDLDLSPATIEACIDSYVSRAKTDGFTVTLMTILPSTTINVPFPGFSGTWDSIPIQAEEVRQEVNNHIRLDTIPDNVFDFSQVLANPYDPNWTFDGTHQTPALDAIIARTMNTFFQQNSAIQNPQQQDGSNPTFNGFVQVGNSAGGDMFSAANLSDQILKPGPGVHTGWNFGGGTEGDFICVPLTGNGTGCSIYATHADGSNPTILGAFTPGGLTTPNVTANGIGGAGQVAAGTVVASTSMTSPLVTSPIYRAPTGQAVSVQGGASSTTALVVRNAAGNANILFVDDATGNTQITGGFLSSKNPPATSTEACTTGEMRDGVISAVAYHFFCFATNQWSRVILTPGGW